MKMIETKYDADYNEHKISVNDGADDDKLNGYDVDDKLNEFYNPSFSISTRSVHSKFCLLTPNSVC